MWEITMRTIIRGYRLNLRLHCTITHRISCFSPRPTFRTFDAWKKIKILPFVFETLRNGSIKRLSKETKGFKFRWEVDIFWTVIMRSVWALEWNSRWNVVFCCAFRSMMKHLYNIEIYIYICTVYQSNIREIYECVTNKRFTNLNM